jgi:hypothetical protein
MGLVTPLRGASLSVSSKPDSLSRSGFSDLRVRTRSWTTCSVWPFGWATAWMVRLEGTFSCVHSHIPRCNAVIRPVETCMMNCCWVFLDCNSAFWASVTLFILQNSLRNSVGSVGTDSSAAFGGEEAKSTICRFVACQDLKEPFSLALSEVRSLRRPWRSFFRPLRLAVTFWRRSWRFCSSG